MLSTWYLKNVHTINKINISVCLLKSFKLYECVCVDELSE